MRYPLAALVLVGIAFVPSEELWEAAKKGDADAIYEMLSEKSKRGLSRDEVKKLVADERAELSDQAKAVSAPRYRRLAQMLVKRPVLTLAIAVTLVALAAASVHTLAELRDTPAQRPHAGRQPGGAGGNRDRPRRQGGVGVQARPGRLVCPPPLNA